MENFREHTKVDAERAILVGAFLKKNKEFNDNLAELTALAESAGAMVVDRFQQKLNRIHAATYIGPGKAKMLWDRVEDFEADVVIFDNDLSPGQIRELEKIIEIKVIDRSELILDIFASRARTAQAKLQVELAQLEYTYPRLTRMWSHLDSVAGAGGGTAAGAVGGIGTRGTGEKQLEIDRRLVSKRITDLKRQLTALDKRKMREIDARSSSFKICLVGYTNAGKSTLMNTLTGADVYVEDRLFATLDTRTRKWQLEGGKAVLLSDTVGFVRKLPHQLVASFKATLEEAVNADLLLHVIDVSSPEAISQAENAMSVLDEIDCSQHPMLVVLNKADAVNSQSQLETLQTIYPDAICISAKTGMNLDILCENVAQIYGGNESVYKVTLDISDGKVQSFLAANTEIIDQQYLENHVVIHTRLTSNTLAQLKSLGCGKIEAV
ncbi:MAG: GTPase HflX [Anaerohalosphaeraceae bacterium]|nr:GTPase HflX [Anaerohalosphaeraceae bacterium]